MKANSFINKNDRPWPNRRLKIGAIVGHTTEISSRLWLRTGKPGQFALLYFPVLENGENDWFEKNKHNSKIHLENNPSNVLIEEFSTTWETDTTYVVELRNLSPGVKYQYALLCKKESQIILGHDRHYRFSTLKTDDNPFRFGLFSCHMPFKESGIFRKTVEIANMDMWTSMQAAFLKEDNKTPLFMIAGGDQCYVDGIDQLNIWAYLKKIMGQKKENKELPSKEEMLSWYRDIYRGYWGFDSVRRIFSSLPTYMIWDDHEMGDGWGSFYLNPQSGREPEWNEIFPGYKDYGYGVEDLKEIYNRMKEAGQQAYYEYEHSHNPPTPEGQYDYHFSHQECEFYVLDGRGHRDINRGKNRILGDDQLQRFQQYAKNLSNTKFLFVVSAVPILHLCSGLVNMENWATDYGNIDDDLRDSWEHNLHDEEREKLMQILFSIAARGIRVCILSGDVHVSAAFCISDEKNNHIYQLTSSAITYNVGTMLGRILGAGVEDNGETKEGYSYERLALYTEPSYSIICVDPKKGEAYFQIYGRQKIQPTKSNIRARQIKSFSSEEEKLGQLDQEKPIFNSIAKIKIW